MSAMKFEVARINLDGEIHRGGIYTTDVARAAAWAESKNRNNTDEKSFYIVVEADENAVPIGGMTKAQWLKIKAKQDGISPKTYHFTWFETFCKDMTVKAYSEEEAWEIVESLDLPNEVPFESCGSGYWEMGECE